MEKPIPGLAEQAAKEAMHGVIDQAGHKQNFLMCQEYYDFIEFLQNKLGFDEVYDLQEEFGGSFTRPE
jgi:hypothetical protein